MQEAALDKVQAGFRAEEIAQTRAMLAGNSATVANLQQTVERLQSLRKAGGISQQNLEDAQARYREAVAQRDATKKQLDMMEAGYREEDIAVQKAMLEIARAQLSKAQTVCDDTVLLAPDSGVVLTKARERGAIVGAGQTVYSVTLINPVYIRAFVPQPKLGLIKPGAPASIEIDAMPGELYSGVVGYISSTAEFTPKSVETREVRNDLVFRIRIIAEDPTNVMRQGMPVTLPLPCGPM
jgi:HlyD family secretion protein